MPRQSKKVIRAKQETLAQIVAQNPGLTIQKANNELKQRGFAYRLTPGKASPIVRSARVTVQVVQRSIAAALGMAPALEVAPSSDL